ncbi:hypothetical protein CERZMDRAFT_88227 [Cercospora zeae-maydis SCOH1-5]|uniref:Uncharacterized protein n=1 Tax=Cercospora zeae-maydis SCOH1-5 TaxID=717836 RepID=A0A6A6F371_9PEZI|nr:hypothetical protein CERZMDRAFT_88227 [Cercospora zeae-maydis SCOH1-5]
MRALTRAGSCRRSTCNTKRCHITRYGKVEGAAQSVIGRHESRFVQSIARRVPCVAKAHFPRRTVLRRHRGSAALPSAALLITARRRHVICVYARDRDMLFWTTLEDVGIPPRGAVALHITPDEHVSRRRLTWFQVKSMISCAAAGGRGGAGGSLLVGTVTAGADNLLSIFISARH